MIVFSILITTKNRTIDLLLTLSTLDWSNPEIEVLVMDDGSDEDIRPALVTQFPAVRLFRNENSVGLIEARNRLLSAAKGQYAISLDDDAHFVTPNALASIKTHFDRYPRCGALSFAIYWGKQLPELEAATSKQAFSVVKSFVGCGHAWRMDAWRNIPDYPGWFVFGGEERFAASHLFLKGWEVHYLPYLLVHHRVDMQARRNTSANFYKYHKTLRAGLYLFILFYPWTAALRALAYSIAVQVQKRLLQERNWIMGKGIVLALRDVLIHLPRLLKQRSAFTSQQWQQWRNLPDEVVYWQPPNLPK